MDFCSQFHKALRERQRALQLLLRLNLLWEAENEVGFNGKAGFKRIADCCLCLRHGMSSSQPFERCVRAALNPNNKPRVVAAPFQDFEVVGLSLIHI